jgi:hypothetical protein
VNRVRSAAASKQNAARAASEEHRNESIGDFEVLSSLFDEIHRLTPSALPPCHQIRSRRFHQQMVVVCHENPSMHTPAGAAADLAKRFQEQSPVHIIPDDWFAVIPAVEQMINRAGEF